MAFDIAMFADKLTRYCNQLEIRVGDLSSATGISMDRIQCLLDQKSEPTGDEVLILADFFKCDYKFFISNEPLAPFEQTESLFRKYGDELTREDKWAIQEFLFLCECEEFLMSILNTKGRNTLKFQKRGTFFKQHGWDAASALRKQLGYRNIEIPADVYNDFRSIGLHVFRRQLGKSSISGLCILHPVAGKCVLVNYSEDSFRQRFSAAHEAGHAILNEETDPPISFSQWKAKDLSEIRANAFASHFLLPPEYLTKIPDAKNWDETKIQEWAVKLKVNPEPLLLALKDSGLLDNERYLQLKHTKIPRGIKIDPELPQGLPEPAKHRKADLLKRGLSTQYVNLCFTAYDNGLITAGRLAEMLLLDKAELPEVANLYGRALSYGH